MLSLIAVSSVVLSTQALAWEHEGHHWEVETLHFSMGPGLLTTLPQAVDPTTGLTTQELILNAAWCNWLWSEQCATLFPERSAPDVPSCVNLHAIYAPLSTDATPYSEVHFTVSDDKSAPGIDYEYADDGVLERARVVIDSQMTWLSSEVACEQGELYLEAFLTHQIGHILGLAHSCDDGDACSGELASATMFWAYPSCELSAASIEEDDIAGLTALYTPSATLTSDPETPAGALPLEVTYTLVSNVPAIDVAWRFGDGESGEGQEVTHTYTTQGQYSVSMDFILDGGACGEVSGSGEAPGRALACGVPEPAFSYVELADGRIRTVNLTAMDTPGCIDEVQWEIYSGATLLTHDAWEPELLLTGEGEHTIVLTVRGLGGGASTALAVAPTGRGCGVPAPAGLIGVLLAAAAAARRRL